MPAFGASADKAVVTWSDGKLTADDFLAAITLLEQGATLALDFLVAGVTDLANAIGGFFLNVGEAIGCFFGAGEW